jgi:transcriptional regulator with GAF, ATPase, and Fis domain
MSEKVMSHNFQCPIGRIAARTTSSLDLDVVLGSITSGLVKELDVSFARIWLIRPGDLCDSCHMSASCTDRAFCLHLKASAGLYTNLDGRYRRFPMGAKLLGHIAVTEEPIFATNVSDDPRFSDKEWLKQQGFESYVGYPLVFAGERLGVLAMFRKRRMSDGDFDCVAGLGNQAAISIKNAQLFGEVKRLGDQLLADNLYLREEIKRNYDFEEIVGQSEGILKVLRQVEQVAPLQTPVLLLGETGTGKELIARAIHHLSERKARPLVNVNCAALSPNLIESELFGHERGAFTGAHARRMGRFELADGTTIFLDEVGDLPREAQAKLLRVLQEGEFERVGSSKSMKVDVRVLAATNRDLKMDVDRGTFRKDLYYRLNVFPIYLPPLRERRDDIVPLVKHFITKYGRKHGRGIDHIPRKTLRTLESYTWEGNVRELENVVERAVISSSTDTLRLDDLFELRCGSSTEAGAGDSLLDVERTHILRVLEDCRWIVEGDRGAAGRLNLKPSTLRSRMRKLGITRRP